MNGKISKQTLILFRAEIDNETEGGITPSTLGSALSSLEQGYEPYDNFNSEVAEKDINYLIDEHGENYLLENFNEQINKL